MSTPPEWVHAFVPVIDQGLLQALNLFGGDVAVWVAREPPAVVVGPRETLRAVLLQRNYPEIVLEHLGKPATEGSIFMVLADDEEVYVTVYDLSKNGFSTVKETFDALGPMSVGGDAQ